MVFHLVMFETVAACLAGAPFFGQPSCLKNVKMWNAQNSPYSALIVVISYYVHLH